MGASNRSPGSARHAITRHYEQHQTMTYTRTDSGEKRLGHIADEVEEALAELGVANVSGATNYAPGDLPYGVYTTLQYDRMVPLLVSIINSLAGRVQELESAPKKKRNGTAASKPL